MKTQKELAINIDGLLSKVSNDNLRHELRVAFSQYREIMSKMVYDCAINLAHPAYSHSTSTSIGIDNLRERALDFLEIPKEEQP